MRPSLPFESFEISRPRTALGDFKLSIEAKGHQYTGYFDRNFFNLAMATAHALKHLAKIYGYRVPESVMPENQRCKDTLVIDTLITHPLRSAPGEYMIVLECSAPGQGKRQFVGLFDSDFRNFAECIFTATKFFGAHFGFIRVDPDGMTRPGGEKRVTDFVMKPLKRWFGVRPT